jgi:Pvc16 N-terminal domain
MSDARAIEAVTETLRGIVDAGVKTVTAGARAITLPPNAITASLEPRVNVFLYQAEIDGALRNTPPIGVAAGETARPALPLCLYYLITPYAPDADDVQAHRLLGGALMALHSHPVLTPADLADAAPYSDIAYQVESVRISWWPLTDKDIYSLWSVFQAPYRVSTAFELRVVLIDSTVAASAPLPVLRRGADGSGPTVAASPGYPGPEITSAVPPGGQPTALPGEQVQVLGAGLAEAVTVRLSHPVLPAPLTFPPDEVAESQVTFTVPADAPAGFGTVALSIATTGPGDWLTNDSPLGVGPQITSQLPATVAAAQHSAQLTVTCRPPVRAGQNAALLIGGTTVPASPITATTSDLTFTVGPLPEGPYPLRLRVDGADTRLIDLATTPPSYIENQSVTATS